MGVGDTFEQGLSSLESTLGIYNDRLDGGRIEQSQSGVDYSTLTPSPRPRPRPQSHPRPPLPRLAASPMPPQANTTTKKKNHNSNSPFKHLDAAVTSLDLMRLGIGSPKRQNHENDDEHEHEPSGEERIDDVNGNKAKHEHEYEHEPSDETNKSPQKRQQKQKQKRKQKSLPQSPPLAQSPSSQLPDIDEEKSVGEDDYADVDTSNVSVSSHNSNETTLSIARRKVKQLRKERGLMKEAMESLAKATIHQTNRHYDYKRKYNESKQHLQETEEKVTKSIAEKQNFKTSFFQARADYLMEKDIREELSLEVQTLARKMNVLRRDREADEHLKMLLLEQLDDEYPYNECDMSYDEDDDHDHDNNEKDGYDHHYPILTSVSMSTASSPSPSHPEFPEAPPEIPLQLEKDQDQEEEKDQQQQRAEDHSQSKKNNPGVLKKVRFSDEIEHNARVAEMLNAPRMGISPGPNFIDRMTPSELLSNSLESSHEDSSFESIRVSLELEILDLKATIGKKEDRIESLTDRVAYLEGKLHIVRSFLLGDIQHEISSITSFDELQEMLEREEEESDDEEEEEEEEGEEEDYTDEEDEMY